MWGGAVGNLSLLPDVSHHGGHERNERLSRFNVRFMNDLAVAIGGMKPIDRQQV